MDALSILHVLLGIGLLHGVGLLYALWRMRHLNPAGFRYLAIGLTAVTAIIFEELWMSADLWMDWPHIHATTTWMPLLVGPSLWLFARSLSNPGHRSLDWLHYIPALLALIVWLPFYAQSADEKIALISGTQSTPLFISIVGSAKALSLISYLIATLVTLGQSARETRSKLVRRIQIVVFGFLVFVILTLVWFFAEHLHPDIGIPSDLAGSAALATMLYGVSILVIFNWTRFATSGFTSLLEPAPGASKDALLDKNTRLKLFQEIEMIVVRDALYREAGLNVASLSKAVAIPPHYLSFVVNAEVGKSIPAWLNTFRIKDVEDALKQPGKINILEAGLLAGFNSKASFYRAFRSETGMTPNEFREFHFPK